MFCVRRQVAETASLAAKLAASHLKSGPAAATSSSENWMRSLKWDRFTASASPALATPSAPAAGRSAHRQSAKRAPATGNPADAGYPAADRSHTVSPAGTTCSAVPMQCGTSQ
eukprot:4156977-Pyramimonas_sp.AAC.2